MKDSWNTNGAYIDAISHVLRRYDAFDHIGYDATGAKMMRRKTGDRIDMTIGNISRHIESKIASNAVMHTD